MKQQGRAVIDLIDRLATYLALVTDEDRLVLTERLNVMTEKFRRVAEAEKLLPVHLEGVQSELNLVSPSQKARLGKKLSRIRYN